VPESKNEVVSAQMARMPRTSTGPRWHSGARSIGRVFDFGFIGGICLVRRTLAAGRTAGRVRRRLLLACLPRARRNAKTQQGVVKMSVARFQVPAFGHEKSPPLGADVQFLASVDRPPF